MTLACTVPAAHDARQRGELTANWPRANSPEAVHLVHGDYDWIRLGNYRNQSGDACGGRDDCSVVARERIRAGADGFVLLGRGMSVKRGEALPRPEM